MYTSYGKSKRYKDLNDWRLSRILTEIVETHIESADPVGSRTIARRLRFSLSPATIRNIMADLEELGYISHPHTSAGRIPTETGYRHYVNSLMEASHLTSEEESAIRAVLAERRRRIEEILAQTSLLLSQLSRQAALVFFSGLSRDTFKRIALVSLGTRRLLVVFVTTTGLVRNYLLELQEPIDEATLERLARILNEELADLAVSQIETHLKRKIFFERDALYLLFKQALEIVKATILSSSPDQLWLEGTTHILEQPEFRDVERTRALLRFLEEKQQILEILRQDLELGSRHNIHIGSELGFSQPMQICSLITSSYRVSDQVFGMVGILGPTRMEYARTVALVERMADLMSQVLSEWE